MSELDKQHNAGRYHKEQAEMEARKVVGDTPVILDCGDNSCIFTRSRGGMRTNGGCRCLDRLGVDRKSQRPLRMYALEVQREIAALKADYSAVRADREKYRRDYVCAVSEYAVLRAERQALYNALTVRAMSAEGQVRLLKAENERQRDIGRACGLAISHGVLCPVPAALEVKP